MSGLPSGFDAETRGIMPDEYVTHLHLLRHGEVALPHGVVVQEVERVMRGRVVRGQLDVELSGKGQTQSIQLCLWLRRQFPKPDIVWSSDLIRCTAMAEHILRQQGVEYRTDARLREQDMGEWQGDTWSEITARDGAAVTAYWDDYLNARPTGGETYRELHERVSNWWVEQADTVRNKRVVIVTHAGVIRSFQCSLLGIDPSQALRFAPSVASHSGFLISEAGAVQTSFGERGWFVGSKR